MTAALLGRIGALRERLDDVRDDRHFPAHMLSAHDEMLDVLDEMAALAARPSTVERDDGGVA